MGALASPLRMGTSPQLKQKGLEESGEVHRISWEAGAGVREEIFVGTPQESCWGDRAEVWGKEDFGGKIKRVRGEI